MAGTHLSGFGASTAALIDGACMVVVPKSYDDIKLLDRIKADDSARRLRLRIRNYRRKA
jgi:hypothetical protein